MTSLPWCYTLLSNCRYTYNAVLIYSTLCVPHLLEWMDGIELSQLCVLVPILPSNSLLWLCSPLTFLFKNLILSLISLACLFNKIAAFITEEGSLLFPLLYLYVSCAFDLLALTHVIIPVDYPSIKIGTFSLIYNVCVGPSRTQSNLLWKRTENKVFLARPVLDQQSE